MASGRLVDYLGTGLAADKPVSLDLTPGALGIYLSTDTTTVEFWDGTAWIVYTPTIPGTGTVTEILTSDGIEGGPLTTSGTLKLTQEVLDTLASVADKLSDAPVDGNAYNRKNGAWSIATGGGGGIASIVAGAGIAVDDTDPANPVVSISRGTYFSGATSGSLGSASTTTNACKGIVITTDTPLSVTHITALVTPSTATESYKVGIASLTSVTEANRVITGASIDTVLTESASAPTGISTTVATVRRELSSPQLLQPGTYYLLYTVRTDSTGTVAARPNSINAAAALSWDLNFPGITYWGALQFATNSSPSGAAIVSAGKYLMSAEGYVLP